MVENDMRYFLTLPMAALALSAAPALAQDTATPPVTQPDVAAPATDPVAPTPPADPTTATSPATEPTTAPAPTEPAPAPEAANPVDPVAPTTPSSNAPASLTPDQKVAYDSWPATTKSYFDGLTPTRQALFLRLADADKAKVVALPTDQQDSLWASLEKQDAEQKAAPGNS